MAISDIAQFANKFPEDFEMFNALIKTLTTKNGHLHYRIELEFRLVAVTTSYKSIRQ